MEWQDWESSIFPFNYDEKNQEYYAEDKESNDDW